MSNFFTCYLWWLILGFFFGLLLCWLYDILLRRDTSHPGLSTPPSSTPPQPARTVQPARPVTPSKPEPAHQAARPKVEKRTEPAAQPKAEKKVEKKTEPKASTDADSGQNPKDFGFKLKKTDQGDDLTAIEGIGPKISQLLYAEGINTFEKLADTSYERLKEILDKAGPHYRLAKPDAWPKEAALAARGDWKGLKELQDRLVGGVEFDKK